MPRIAFDSFEVFTPRGWVNTTATVEVVDPPPTLTRRDGVGALQFSIATYASGPVPDPSPELLLNMVHESGRRFGMGEPSRDVSEPGPPVLAAASYTHGDDFVRFWYVSDGGNFAFVTYTCAATDTMAELVDCERIVRSIVFSTSVTAKAAVIPRVRRRGRSS